MEVKKQNVYKQEVVSMLMGAKKFSFLLLLLFSLTFITSATTLGTFKEGTSINLLQTCDVSTYANITRIVAPDSSFLINSQLPMDKNGDNYNFTFSNTYQSGTYVVYGVCDENGSYTTWVYDFIITPSGNSGNSNTVFFVFLVVLIYAITFVGFFGKNVIVSIMGGMFMIALSLYMLSQGIIIYRDWITNYLAYITMAIGAYIAIISALALINGDYD